VYDRNHTTATEFFQGKTAAFSPNIRTWRINMERILQREDAVRTGYPR
jgi:hypothetical protein